MAFNNYKVANHAQGTLLAGIAAGTTTVILGAGQGELFPSTFPFFVKCEKYDTALNNYRVLKREIWKVTNRVSDTLTVVRSSGTCPPDYATLTQGTTAFSFDAGDTVSHVITAEQEKDNQDELLRLETDKLDKVGGTVTGNVTLSGAVILGSQGADIASATTTNLATATGNRIKVTGTTTITSFGTVTAGTEFTITFTGILTLTHNATSLILPTASNITTAAGDSAVFISLGSGNWKCTSYNKADGSQVATIQVTTPVTQITVVAGENLTAGNAVYISNGTGARTSGRAYKADCSDVTYTDSFNFVGFAAETITAGNNIKINTEGVDTNQSGLTIGATYFLSTTAGTITTTPAANVIEVGVAISATSIMINSNAVRTDIVNFTRDMATATGAVTYTHSLGKIPKTIQLSSVLGTTSATESVGGYANGKNYCSFPQNAGGNPLQSTSFCYYRQTLNDTSKHTGAVTAVTANDFTITWTKTGTPTGIPAFTAILTA